MIEDDQTVGKISMNCELCQEHISRDRLFDLEGKHEEIVHFELTDDQPL